MHIPKTAGVSVVGAFTERLGVEACKSFSPTIGDEDFINKRFVSGHVYLGDITKSAFLFTFLRDPVKQLVSHLLWIDHYNMPEYEHETIGFPSSVIEGIRALRGKDLSSARTLIFTLPEFRKTRTCVSGICRLSCFRFVAERSCLWATRNWRKSQLKTSSGSASSGCRRASTATW